MKFENLKIIEPICKALSHAGYESPTPVQTQTIPLALEGKDVLGSAQTGTGKTAAFTIPILQFFYEHKDGQPLGPRFLILAPTRELAIQIGENFSNYGRFTSIKHAVIFGGVSQRNQEKVLKTKVDAIIATPGRLLDLVNQKIIKLNSIQILVLDEADKMLSMGFIDDVREIIRRMPKKRQTLFFSATMPREIKKLADEILTNPSVVEVSKSLPSQEKINQELYHVDKGNKNNLLIHLLKDDSLSRVLVFSKTKHTADKIVKELNRNSIHSNAIHGNKNQNARQRALTDFKKGKLRVLVATDIASRGIDVDEITHVINYELPNDPETYVHRIGRTGRAGSTGKAISFCDQQERNFLRSIERLAAKSIQVNKENPFPIGSPVPKSNTGSAASSPETSRKPEESNKRKPFFSRNKRNERNRGNSSEQYRKRGGRGR